MCDFLWQGPNIPNSSLEPLKIVNENYHSCVLNVSSSTPSGVWDFTEGFAFDKIYNGLILGKIGHFFSDELKSDKKLKLLK